MKELKFRAWHKESNKYLNVVSNIGFENKVILVNENGYVSRYLFEEVIIEQYTGLKDRNGKEIYVGDIAKSGKFIFPINDKDIYIHSKSNNDSIEIIGNIHENKELLNG